MKNYARFFQDLATKYPKTLTALKASSAAAVCMTYGNAYLEVEKRYAQTFFTHYLDTRLTPAEKHRYNTEQDYRKNMNEEIRHAYKVCTRPDI